jgi:hypothetical protein
VLKQAHSCPGVYEQLSTTINSLTLIIRKLEDGVGYLVVRSTTETRTFGHITLTSGIAPTPHAAMIAARTICDGIETDFDEIPKTVGLTYSDHYVTRSWRGRRAFHILLVEQETHFLDALQKMLDANYQVSSARTVLEAQAIVQTSHLDVVLVGSVLSDGQGPDFVALAERLGAAVIEIR